MGLKIASMGMPTEEDINPNFPGVLINDKDIIYFILIWNTIDFLFNKLHRHMLLN